MELTITHRNENKLLERVEVEAEVTYDAATPSYQQVSEQLAATLKVPAEKLAIAHVYPAFSYRKAKVIARVYDSAEALEKIEKIKKKPKKKEAAAPAAKKK